MARSCVGQFRCNVACEFNNKVGWAALVLTIILLTCIAPVAAQHSGTPVQSTRSTAGGQMQPEGSGQHVDAEHAEAEHGMFAGLLWPTANFLILAGGLWWFLHEPLAGYLKERHSSIRQDLVDAAAIKSAATAQLAELDRKLHALPAEIDALRRRGAEEIAAEEARIAATAAAERERLLEQTRREIDVQVRLAKRELIEHAADISIQLAGERIEQQITSSDQTRLIARYLEQVRGAEGADARH